MKIIKKTISWIFALIIATIFVNFIMLMYNRQVGWIERDKAATYGIWNPGKTLVHATEGFGIYTADEKGYLNSGELVSSGYTLAVGASYTQGKEVLEGLRYTDLLNDYFVKDGVIEDGKLLVYNVSQDSYYFPAIVNGFQGIIGEFPDSKNIIIEIGTTEYEIDKLKTCINQRGYDASQDGNQIVQTLSSKKKMTMALKEWFPLLNQLKSQLNLMNDTDNGGAENEETIDLAKYEETLNEALALIRSEYSGNIIICYHPSVTLSNDGLQITEQDTTAVFSRLCEQNGIEFLDMSDAFFAAYEEDCSIPYGYWNTTMGTGHLSKAGHRTIANELYKILVCISSSFSH